MMNIHDIIVTQDSLRNIGQIPEMTEFVAQGGFFTPDILSKFGPIHPIALTRFEDGSVYLRDGHHRVGSILLAGRDHLIDEEYIIDNMTYQDYLDIVFQFPDGSWMGWVTPIDVRTEIRLPEIGEFKRRVKEIFHAQSDMHARHFILTNKHRYAVPRTLYTVQDLVDKLLATAD